jgi:putative NADPH-quinone reductase
MALIIVGHPNLSQSVANKTIIERLQQSGLDLEIRDIHGLYPNYQINAKAEQEALLRHNTVVFQYPFYWYNVPAILKLWFDTVFEYQFAYGSKGDKLKGKNFIPSFTVGAPQSGYTTLGNHHFRVNEFTKSLEQTAYYAQMNYVEPIYFHGTSPAAGFTKEDVKSWAQTHADRLVEKLTSLQSSAVVAVN